MVGTYLAQVKGGQNLAQLYPGVRFPFGVFLAYKASTGISDSGLSNYKRIFTLVSSDKEF